MKSGQKGFTVVETLLVLILLAILGFTGYYVWHSQKQTDKTLSTAASEQLAAPAKKSTTSKAPASSNKIVFKEFGVQMSVPSSLHGLSYKASVSDGTTTLGLSLPSTSALIAKCGGQANNGTYPFIVLEKFNGTYSPIPGSDMGLLKQFPNFWIGGLSGIQGVSCPNPVDQQQLSTQYSSSLAGLKTAFQSATLIQ